MVEHNNTEIQEKSDSGQQASEASAVLLNDVLDSAKDGTASKGWLSKDGESKTSGFDLPALTLRQSGPDDAGGFGHKGANASELESAVISGDTKDIQDVLANCKTLADYDQLQDDVDDINEKYGTKIDLTVNPEGNPELDIRYNQHPFTVDIEVSADSASAESTLTGGFNPRNTPSHEVDPDEALKDLQEAQQDDRTKAKLRPDGPGMGLRPDGPGTEPVGPGTEPDGPRTELRPDPPKITRIGPDQERPEPPGRDIDPGFYVDTDYDPRDVDPGFYVDTDYDPRDVDPGFYVGDDKNFQKKN